MTSLCDILDEPDTWRLNLEILTRIANSADSEKAEFWQRSQSDVFDNLIYLCLSKLFKNRGILRDKF